MSDCYDSDLIYDNDLGEWVEPEAVDFDELKMVLDKARAEMKEKGL